MWRSLANDYGVNMGFSCQRSQRNVGSANVTFSCYIIFPTIYVDSAIAWDSLANVHNTMRTDASSHTCSNRGVAMGGGGGLGGTCPPPILDAPHKKIMHFFNLLISRV